MNCPNCAKSALIARTVKGKNIQVDVCGKCKGIWFEKDELSTLLGVGRMNIQPQAGASGAEAWNCPACSVPMAMIVYPGTMVVIDHCGRCSGIWLDDNEIQELAKARLAAAAKPQAKAKAAPAVPKITCPKCGAQQAQSDSCVKCGVYFAKWKKKEEQTAMDIPPPPDKLRGDDAIPGVKGSMIRYVNRTIDRLVFW